jgi:hypothetical protein
MILKQVQEANFDKKYEIVENFSFKKKIIFGITDRDRYNY